MTNSDLTRGPGLQKKQAQEDKRISVVVMIKGTPGGSNPWEYVSSPRERRSLVERNLNMSEMP